ncbi:mitochondrial K+-H+ exchange-related-domain-containing protein [Elsinoe ampelina]|uniref:Mitochondrial K+-H+ exchange-related-domain-containing protein n=1 Tax=Elsinoe ampelina TaxID=302913 RepID=A0A6A6GGZ1_9PEZI|nr:mitochondrial K+-H+ exchange-related-domain-containing protein [Elsinoe ampelina]
MRIFLLPISTRRTLIYCEKLPSTSPASTSLSPFPLSNLPDRIVARANNTWADWERAPTGWKKTLTGYGNRAFARIPFEEWGLKSLPALHESTKERAGRTEVVFPGKFVEGGAGRRGVLAALERLSREREGLHRRRLVGSVVAMPFTIPVGLIPVLPNVPFIYLAFRAWSHYKAWYGGRYLAWLLGKGWVVPRGSKVLDELYARGFLEGEGGKGGGKVRVRVEEAEVERVAREVKDRDAKGEEVLVLKAWNGQAIAEEFKLPEMEVEIERAVEQVQKAIEEAKTAKPSVQATKE